MNLIPDVLTLIFQELEMEDLGNVCTVCKDWNGYSSSDDVWMLYSYNHKPPNIKPQVKKYLTELATVYNEINKQMTQPIISKFFCGLIKLLFDGNIHRVRSKQFFTFDQVYDRLWFTIKSKRERRVYFNDVDIHNFVVPKKVMFYVDYNGIKFNDYVYYKKYPMYINCSNDVIGHCEEVFLSWEKNLYAFYEQPGECSNCMVSTNKENIMDFLDGVLFVKEF